MANFRFMNDINTAIAMDEPITRGPMPRWQKKGLEASNSSLNISLNASRSRMNNSSLNYSSSQSKTPSKGGSQKSKTPSKTPSRTPKTPSKSPGSNPPSKSPTPGKKTPSGGDRFIPNRTASDFNLGHFKLTHRDSEENCSPSQTEKQRIMAENLHGRDISNQRILSYQNKAPLPPEGYQNHLKVVYTQSKTPASVKSSTRFIPQAPDRILDAPDIYDDYYLNLIDWGSNNVLAVALGSSVYLWNAATGGIEQLLDLEPSDYVSSLSWIQAGEGEHLAVGTSLGTVQLWDTVAMKRERVMTGHVGRVGSLSWNSYILSSGSRTGQIIHSDVRQREHCVMTLNGHTQEVCGLKWSPDGRYLASGGNDNLLNVWPLQPDTMYSQPQPLYSLSAHQAAVKAVAWCPWQPHILASGGGTADRSIRFWNCNTGILLNTVDTKSQVCSILWSSHYKELISGHGYANNQLIIWKYPTMTKVTELTGHSARVLHMAMSPDGSTVMSAGADETLRLWKCFAVDPSKKKTAKDTKSEPSLLKPRIR